MLKKLKIIRVAVSLLFLLCITFLFLDISHRLDPDFFTGVLWFQFLPSLLEFIDIPSVVTGGFIVVVLLTLLFGRVYCSALCPLGALQDIMIWLRNKFDRNKFKYKKPHTILRYSILAITATAFFSGSLLLLNLLDPFSGFGRIASDLARPVYIMFNNLLAGVFESSGSEYFYYVDIIPAALEILVFPVALLLLTGWLSVRYGRLYCNTVCPVGAILGLLSKVSLFRIAFDKSACTSCGACERKCKAQCIDSENRELDFSRCVGCFNCFRACPSNGFRYEAVFHDRKTPATVITTDTYRRRLITGTAGLFLASAGLRAEGRARACNVRRYPVSPPGSESIEHFTANCLACHLCVSACPTFVLQPSFLSYGISGIMQPVMDFSAGFCNYECNVCGTICPSGAIFPLTVKEKIVVQTGRAKFVKSNCVVVTDGTDCGACSEHCPTKAVRMEPYGNLVIPVVNEKQCVGCGACEHICPTTPNKAIYVEGNPIHLTAEPPRFEKLDYDVDYKEDFPF